jgi:Tol biopolymer transport system component
MAADGEGQRRLLASDSDDWDPAWSPDGAHLAFARFTGTRVELWTVRADGGGARRLTTVCAVVYAGSPSARCLGSHPAPAWRR